MGRSRRGLRSAIVMTMCLGASSGGSPAVAQQYDATLQSLDYLPDPLSRSARLLGMGRLTLADDPHNHIGLWDFAGNPTGIAHAESTSSIEYRPGTRTSRGFRDVLPAKGERQLLEARQMRHGFEAWKRASGGTAYGATGEVATLQRDRPFGETKGEREKFLVPVLQGAVNGRLPWVSSTRFDYALRVGYTHETYDDLYFEYLRFPQGQYLDAPSTDLPPRDLFTPDHAEVSNLGLGAAVSMRVTPGITAALGYDREAVRVKGTNEGLRSNGATDERRPFNILQASIVGRVGRHLEFGADGRAWRSESEEFFVWTVSAGQGQIPLAGSGKRLDRSEEGTSLRTRARLIAGSLELGGSMNTSFRRRIVTPWYPVRPDDPPGFNNFLDEVGFRVGADTLLLPQRVQLSRVKETGYEFAGGAIWHLPRERGTLGAEVHRWRRLFDQRSLGAGPEPAGWDVRAGGEYRCTDALVTRAGWGYGLSDDDDLVADNRYRHATATIGFGCQPMGSKWSFDLGYAIEWVNPDFADPTHARETRRRLAVQTRWPF